MERMCPYCLHPAQPGSPCPHCGKDPGTYQPGSHHFPPGKLLHERYLLGRVLGEGGFGITYFGLDIKLERRVAVKEYFPTTFVKREASVTLDVTCYTASGEKIYQKGREQFLQEARTMARLEEIPEIVRVLDFFPENNTAYIVMEFLEGETLKDLTARRGPLPAAELLSLVRPVLGAMEKMHQAGVIHRDISPDNLMVLKNGAMKLMDFGCARDVGGEATMTVTLKHGFAPYEQYTGHGQGPWSDLYSLCATVYYCLTGRVPPDAMEREDVPLTPPSQFGAALSEGQEQALLKGLALYSRNRWQSAGDLYGALYGVTMDGQPWTPPEEQSEEQPFRETEYIHTEEGREHQTDPIGGTQFVAEEENDTKADAVKARPALSKRAKGGIAAAACLVILAAAAFAGWKWLSPADAGNTLPADGGITVAAPDNGAEQTPGDADIPIPDVQDAVDGDLNPADADPDVQDAPPQENEAAPDDPEPSGGETTGSSTAPPPPADDPPASSGEAQSSDPPPAAQPTKAELEAQVESLLESQQFDQAAEVYRQMNTLGYISTEKLSSSLVDVGSDAEYYWSETDFGNNSSPYIKTAFDLYTEAAGMGNTQAYASIAYCYDYGHYVSRDPAMACQWWTKLANTGDGPACYFVAEYYADGNGVAQDIPTAIDWLNKCLEYGASYMESDARALLEELQGA